MSNVLWCGGEDIDFPVGPGGPNFANTTNASFFNSGFARCGINGSGNANEWASSIPFSGGAVTSLWLHFVLYDGTGVTSETYCGVSASSAANGAGLYVGTDSTTAKKLALWKYDGTTWTELASESGNSAATGSLITYDMQISGFGGGSPSVTVYVNGVAKITYTTAISITGVTAFDCVAILSKQTFPSWWFSEFIVTDTLDTRTARLLTGAPNAAGTTNNWTGAYTNINPLAENDTSVVTVNTTGQDFQANVTDMPSGYSIQAVKIAARSELTNGATPTLLKLGINEGGTISVDSGQSVAPAWFTYERLMTTDPVTSGAWNAANWNSLQLDLRSG